MTRIKSKYDYEGVTHWNPYNFKSSEMEDIAWFLNMGWQFLHLRHLNNWKMVRGSLFIFRIENFDMSQFDLGSTCGIGIGDVATIVVWFLSCIFHQYPSQRYHHQHYESKDRPDRRGVEIEPWLHRFPVDFPRHPQVQVVRLNKGVRI